MKSLNKTIIIGRLGKDPETKVFTDGGKIVNATIATSITWKDKKTDEWQEKVQWHSVCIKNTYIIDKVMTLKKGEMVYCEGDLEYRKYTGSDGVEKNITEIVVYPIRGMFDRIGDAAKENVEHTVEKPKEKSTKVTYADLDDDVPF